MKLSLLLASAGVLVLGACAAQTPPPSVAAAAIRPVDDDGGGGSAAYGLYLAGQAAAGRGDAAVATEYMQEAARLSGDPEVRESAFTAAVLAGDIGRAAALAPEPATGSPAALRLGRLVAAVEHLASGKPGQAQADLAGEPVGYPHRSAAALLKPWVAAAAGDWQTALAEPELKSDRLAYNLGSLSRAQLMERNRRYDEAEALLKQMSGEDSGEVFRDAYGAFLERRGRAAEAVALYDAALAKAPTDSRLLAARERAAARRSPPPLPDVRAGAAQALLGVAAQAALLKQADLSLVYVRLALRLNPKEDEAWLLLGDTLLAGGDRDGGRAAYDKVDTRSPIFVEARSRTIWTYQEPAERETALRLAREMVRQSPGSALAKTTLADVLRVNKQYAEAAQVLDEVIAAAGERAGWRLYYLRAISLDQAGRWPDAERDLQAALKMKPEEPEVLNYLGYSWIDRGERLDEALGMIQQALLAQPDSGAIVDSLGWALYRLGEYDKAVPQLERAAQLEPAAPDINAHLGDAYWQVGRRIEAEFQWRKVLTTMEPDDELKAEIEAKLKSGLQAPPAKVAGR